jgi:hypothetical protein
VFKPVVRCTEEVAVWTVCEIEAVLQVNCLSRRARHAACCSSSGNQTGFLHGRVNRGGVHMEDLLAKFVE